ncbi:MAG TPA: hypothetical protein VEV19_11795 [Ktedonobacteraceae bacterium]|nr:hypothetical protein [Ktedonobacteraceae bacterium]
MPSGYGHTATGTGRSIGGGLRSIGPYEIEDYGVGSVLGDGVKCAKVYSARG